jgi:hypothetical protein
VRRLWPWLVGLAILVIVATRIPLDRFRTEISRGPHGTLAAVDLAVIAMVLGSTGVDLIGSSRCACGWKRRKDVFAGAVRPTSCVPGQHALGQGGFGYYLHRSYAKPLRCAHRRRCS